MPGFDQTGPLGGGPATGGGRGRCTPRGRNLSGRQFDTPYGRSWGGGRRGGGRFGNGGGYAGRPWFGGQMDPYGYAAPPDRRTEETALREEARMLREKLNEVQTRMDQLTKTDDEN